MNSLSNEQKRISQAQKIALKGQSYFAKLAQKEPLIGMDNCNRICKYYPDGRIEVLKDLARA